MADPKKPATTIAPWQVLDSKYSYRDRWLAVRSDIVRVPNGTILSPYHTIEFPEWVCAIALTPEREIVLIEEYRHGIERNSFELPCGTPDHEGESVLEATKRELREETGYAAERWRQVSRITLSNSVTDERGALFIAEGLTAGVAEPDASEVLETRWATLAEVLAEIAAGEIHDLLTIAGVGLYAAERLREGTP